MSAQSDALSDKIVIILRAPRAALLSFSPSGLLKHDNIFSHCCILFSASRQPQMYSTHAPLTGLPGNKPLLSLLQVYRTHAPNHHLSKPNIAIILNGYIVSWLGGNYVFGKQALCNRNNGRQCKLHWIANFLFYIMWMQPKANVLYVLMGGVQLYMCVDVRWRKITSISQEMTTFWCFNHTDTKSRCPPTIWYVCSCVLSGLWRSNVVIQIILVVLFESWNSTDQLHHHPVDFFSCHSLYISNSWAFTRNNIQSMLSGMHQKKNSGVGLAN